MDHYQPEANGYEEQLIRDNTLSVINRLYQRERRKVCKKAKARVRNTLALLRTQLEWN
jgi:hypothetical protein